MDQSNRNYYPAPFSQAIDSSLDSLGDRSDMIRVKSPLGLAGLPPAGTSNLPGSPILAPSLDVYGQLRGDDDLVATPAGQGGNVFVDRGAIDRVDFFQPQAVLALPEDQSSLDGDLDVDEVWIDESQILREFRIRLNDEGIGVDGLTVSSSQFVLKRIDTDGVTEITLIDGVDYTFVYNVITKEAIFNAATFFADENTEVRYIILVDNNGTSVTDTVDGVRDRAGNYLQANRPDDTTRFDIVLTDGVNDPPENRVPGSQTTAEDVSLVFNATNGNAISIFDQDAHLGTNILTVTLTATNGRLTLGTIPATLLFASGDGTLDATMEFTGKLQDINAALTGLTFVPNLDYFGPASVTILTSDLGEFSGPAESTSTTIAINVTEVNDPPVLNPLVNPAPVNEDAGLVTIVGFMTGQSAGPANESPPQTITTTVTVVSENSNWTPATFFAVAPSINRVTGTLTFRTAQDVNGTATISVLLTDNGTPAATSLTQTFVFTITPVNDAPVFTSTTTDARVNSSGNITTLEDAGVQTINYVATSAAARSTALDEVGAQAPLTWTVSAATRTSGNLAFSQISVNPTTGVLTYKTTQDTAGSATVTLTLRDAGSGVSPNINATTRVVTINATQVNDAPVAVTGNYVVDEGYGITLNASGSFDVDAFFGDTLTYAWDLDNNGTFETSIGGSSTQTFTWAYLANLGITAPDVSTIRLRVTDSSGAANNTGFVNATLTTLIVDYGDAPNTYGTLRTSNGAAHTIAGPLKLGATIDEETTGQPSATATGDGSDEDGVTFPTSFETTGGQALPAYVDVTASAAGKLDVWLDLNRNGAFSAAEKLNNGSSYSVEAGVNRINFTIPAGSTVGDTFMRFRLSTAGSLSATGRANDGEVEDYAVKVKSLQNAVPPVINRPIDFNLTDGKIPQTSDLTPTIAWSLHEANFNYLLVVKNSLGNTVFTSPLTSFTSVDVTPALPKGIYTATLTAFNKANVAAAPLTTYQFEVVPLVVASPSGDVVTSRPVINWNAVEGSKTYNVVIESLTTGLTVVNQTITTATVVPPAIPNQFTPTTNLPLGRYRVRVRATDAADLLGDWSAFRLFTVRTAPVLTAPASFVTVLRPTVTWNPVAGAVSYRVTLTYITDTVVLPATATVTATVTTTSWTPTTDLKLGEYRVTVQAFNAANATGDSSVISPVRTFLVRMPPISTQPLQRVPDTTPTFSWSAVPGADRYELVVSKKWGTFDVVISQSNLTTTSFTQPTSLGLGRYTYRIRAINDPTASGAASVTSTDAAVYEFVIVEPPIVTGPSLTSFSNHPVISWVNPPNSEKSDIWVDQVGGQSQYLRVNGVTGSTYTPNEKLFGIGTYQVWVRTYSNTDDPTTPRLPNGTGDEREPSDWSIGRVFRVSTPPTLVGPVGRTPVANPTLSWQSVPGALNYEIWINNNSVPVGSLYNQTGITSLSYTVPANLPIGEYSFWVRARNAFGFNSNWSVEQKFQIVTSPVLTGPSASTFIKRPTFNWTNMMTTLRSFPAGAARYEFRLYAPDPVTFKYVELPQYTVTNLTTNSYTIPTDLPSNFYRAYVVATADGRPSANVPATRSNWSFALEFFVGGRPIVNPIPPTTDTTPTLSWGAVGGASGYEVFLATAAMPGTNLLNASNSRTGSTSFVVPQALTKGVYRYWVRAFNASTGAASNWSLQQTLTIVQATTPVQEQSLPDATEFVWTVVPGFVPQTLVTESAISMVPAVVDGSQYLPLPAEVLNPNSDVPLFEVESAANAVPTAEDTAATDQTDSVLSKWDEQTWWESQPAAEKPAEAERKSSTAAFLGALFALAPRSLRRRKDE
ncbi:MAG: GEVED domain-containing protein [Planctomycetaceae bacterium]